MKYIVALTLFFICSQHSVSAQLKKDIEAGLYFSTPDWIFVQQLKNDTLESFKLLHSREHFEKVTRILVDSILKSKSQDYSSRDTDKRKIVEILEISDKRGALIFHSDSGYNASLYIRKQDKYEMYWGFFNRNKKKLIKELIDDTKDYFMISSFTLHDLVVLSKKKKLSQATAAGIDSILNYIYANKERFSAQARNNKQISMYGSMEGNEILVKVLMELNYYPIVFPGEFDKIYRKYKKQ